MTAVHKSVWPFSS